MNKSASIFVYTNKKNKKNKTNKFRRYYFDKIVNVGVQLKNNNFIFYIFL